MLLGVLALGRIPVLSYRFLTTCCPVFDENSTCAVLQCFVDDNVAAGKQIECWESHAQMEPDIPVFLLL